MKSMRIRETREKEREKEEVVDMTAVFAFD